LNLQSYNCRHLPDAVDQTDLHAVGDFSWRFYPAEAGDLAGQVAGLAIVLPGLNGQPVHSYQPVVRGAPVSEPGLNAWGWDGNIEAPTLSPSILLHNQWHGFLRAGRLESC